MPSNILTTDTSFPNLNGNQSTDEKFRLITNYLYMLLEQLRYSMANLGRENFNDKEFDDIVNLITEPVYAQLSDAEGNIASLALTAQQLISRMTDAEGNISTLQQTSNSIMSQVSDLEGNVSTLQQTSQAFNVRLTNAEGDLAQVTVTVNGITQSVSDLETGLSQTVRIAPNGVTITNAAGDTLTIDGGQIDATNLNLSGHITFNDFSNRLQDDINSIESTANDAYDLAESNKLPEYLKSTYIDSVRVLSPTIEGGQVKGGRYYNNTGSAYMEIGGSAQGDLILWGSGTNRVFVVEDLVGSTNFTAYGQEFLVVSGHGLGECATPKGTWDFSGANVIGLSGGTAVFA